VEIKECGGFSSGLPIGDIGKKAGCQEFLKNKIARGPILDNWGWGGDITSPDQCSIYRKPNWFIRLQLW